MTMNTADLLVELGTEEIPASVDLRESQQLSHLFLVHYFLPHHAEQSALIAADHRRKLAYAPQDKRKTESLEKIGL